jgi:hypothetical protein
MSSRESFGGKRAAVLGAVIAAVVLLVCAVLATLEMRYRSCIARAEAAYPAVPVSAFTTEDTGPLKVSFVELRQRALDRCERL